MLIQSGLKAVELNFENNNITRNGFTKIIQEIPSLKRLSVKSNYIELSNLDMITRSMEQLNLEDNLI